MIRHIMEARINTSCQSCTFTCIKLTFYVHCRHEMSMNIITLTSRSEDLLFWSNGTNELEGDTYYLVPSTVFVVVGWDATRFLNRVFSWTEHFGERGWNFSTLGGGEPLIIDETNPYRPLNQIVEGTRVLPPFPDGSTPMLITSNY